MAKVQAKNQPKKINLTDQQEEFCLGYATTFNATQAAIDAGYSEKNARSTATNLIKKPHIFERILELVKARREKHELKAELIIERLNNHARCNIFHFFNQDEYNPNILHLKPFSEIPEWAQLCVDSMTARQTENGYYVTIKLCNKQRSEELLGRYLGIWGDNKGDDPENNKPLRIIQPGGKQIILGRARELKDVN